MLVLPFTLWLSGLARIRRGARSDERLLTPSDREAVRDESSGVAEASPNELQTTYATWSRGLLPGSSAPPCECQKFFILDF